MSTCSAVCCFLLLLLLYNDKYILVPSPDVQKKRKKNAYEYIQVKQHKPIDERSTNKEALHLFLALVHFNSIQFYCIFFNFINEVVAHVPKLIAARNTNKWLPTATHENCLSRKMKGEVKKEIYIITSHFKVDESIERCLHLHLQCNAIQFNSVHLPCNRLAVRIETVPTLLCNDVETQLLCLVS